MTREFKKVLKSYALAMVWFFVLLWPFMGIKKDHLEFMPSLKIWALVILISGCMLTVWWLRKTDSLGMVGRAADGLRNAILKGVVGLCMVAAKVFATVLSALPVIRTRIDKEKIYSSKENEVAFTNQVMTFLLCVGLFILPFYAGRYTLDVLINVMIYVCLGLGLNIVVGLCGLLDLGFIAFYGVGAYSYALLSVHFQAPFWICLPIAGVMAAIAGSIIGYPTLRMRGDYLAIVTLGFGEIVRLIMNNWMSLTNGPNGVQGIKAPGLWYPSWADGFHWEHMWLKKLNYSYYIIFALTIFTIIAVYRLNYSRIGRAWEAIREDETAAEVMGVNTFRLKLLAYAMGAFFGGLVGAYFAARMRSVSPTSFIFLESAMVLSMVVLGGMASIPGIILGTLALIALPEVFREFSTYRMLAFGAAMTIMMLFKPAGLIPAKRFGRRSEES